MSGCDVLIVLKITKIDENMCSVSWVVFIIFEMFTSNQVVVVVIVVDVFV